MPNQLGAIAAVGQGGAAGEVSRGARVASAVKSLEIPDSGNAKVDAMGDVFNNALKPFHEPPDPAKGVLGVVEQGIGAVMGVQNLAMEVTNTGFAMATASIAAVMPAFPAAFLTVPHLGIPHAHAHPPSLIPPAPPVPLPSIGVVMAAGCVSVLVCGMPAARCGDLGLAPTCGSLAPAFDIFLGSSNTFIGGNRAARLTDITRHCNPASKSMIVSRGAAIMGAAIGAVGAGASAAAGQAMAAAMAVAQIAADLAAAAMSALCGSDPGIPPAMGALMLGAPTVLIGGFPCPNLPNPFSAMLKGLKKLGSAVAKSKGVGKALKKVGLCNSPGEPIHPFTGEVYNDFDDYRASDSGFVWARHYRSGWSQQDGPLGHGFRHFYQRTLTLLRKRAIYATHDNEAVALAKLEDGSYETVAGCSLSSPDGQRFELRTDRDEILDFEAQRTTPPSARLTRYRTETVDVYLHYDAAGRVRASSEYTAGAIIDTHLTHDADGHIVQLVRGARGQPPLAISRYAYQDGCLVEWYDALGAVARFRYDEARRMVQGTDRRGYSFHWQYDPTTGRCIKSYGDDGLWGVEASYEGNQSTFTEADGGKWHFKHYPDGTISHVVDPLGGIMQYVQDDNGRVVKQLTPAGLEYEWLYDDAGKHTGRRGPFRELLPPEDEDPDPPSPLQHRGPTTQSEWLGGRGHASAQVSPTQLPSAVASQLAAAAGPAAASVLDAAGRVVRMTYANTQVEHFQRDPEGNLLARQDTKGNWWQQQITSWNLVGAERSALGSVTQYGYTHRQQRSFVIDPNGNRTDYRRDRTQRVVEIFQNGKPYLRYQRSAAGSILEERDGEDALLVSHETNALGLHTASTLASGERYTYAYDALGNFVDASSSLHRIEQHYIGRRLTQDLRDGHGIQHKFDEAGVALSVFLRRFKVQYRSGSGGVRLTTPEGGEHRFWREGDGTLVRENANGTSEALVFDAQGRLASRACWRGKLGAVSTTWVARYRYDVDGLLHEVLDSELGPTRYTYDADNRLITQQGPRGEHYDYRYDAAGNLSFTPAHNHIERVADNLLAHSRVERFEYDSRQRLAKRIKYDGTEISYTYDSADQLIGVSFSDRTETWSAAYDGLGRRLWREYAGKRTNFYWDDDRLAGEVAPEGALRVYVYPSEDALVPFMWLDYASVDAEPESGLPHYLFWAPTGMPLRVEDAAGKLVWQAAGIEPYGALATRDAQAPPLRLRFAGHFYDEHLELFYNRFRDYDPALGRYLQPDPLGHAGGPNLYAYCANPAVEVDLRGLIHKAPAKSGTGNAQGAKKKPAKDAAPPKFKKNSADGDPINQRTGLSKKQTADFKARIKAAKTKKAADDVRFERHKQKCANRDPASTPLKRSEWDEKNKTLRQNSKRGSTQENEALDDLGVQNNNHNTDADGKPRTPETYPHESGDGETRPDGVTDKAAVDVKSVPKGQKDGKPRTVNQTDQLRSQRDGAHNDDKEHVTVISSDGPAKDTRPSSNLGDPKKGGSDQVLHRDNKTGQMSQWDPEANNGDGGWKPVSNETARNTVGGDPP